MASDYGQEIRRRRSIRLEGYDYSSSGAYFVTICTKKGMPVWGNRGRDDAVEPGRRTNSWYLGGIARALCRYRAGRLCGHAQSRTRNHCTDQYICCRGAASSALPARKHGRSKQRPYIRPRASNIQIYIRPPGESSIGSNRPTLVATQLL